MVVSIGGRHSPTMIVYGDPQRTISLGEAVAPLRDLLHRANRNSLDHLRAILIQAGEIEQAVEDCEHLSGEGKRLSRELTQVAARNFVGKLENAPGNSWEPNELEALLDALSQGPHKDVSLTLKVPEGFAFYALYPEQYHATAQSWASAHSSAATRTALVLGLRSIGTTLSAVVAETLRRRGWHASRVTARPTGHPFSRRIEIAPEITAGMNYGLIVDEGPGLSGSSFAAAAEALLLNHFATDRITFFPGHANDPGHQGSPHIWEIWQRIARCVPATDHKLLDGKSALEVLCERASAQANTSVSSIRDVGEGRWREFAFASRSDWTAVAPAFERPKFLLKMSDGRRLLWKFTGLSNPFPMDRRTSPFRRPAILDTRLGFSLFSWMEGERLQLADMNQELAALLGGHIEQSALPFDEAEQRQALPRLQNMAEFNTRELLGETSAGLLRELSTTAEEIQTQCRWCYGDGRLAPHEFIRTPSGELFKADEDGPYGDHTVVGPQPVLWDIAGAIIEWNLTESCAAALLEQIPSAEKYNAALPFYCASYAAFRAGLLLLRQGEDTASEQRVLRGAAEFYLKALKSRLCSNEQALPIERTAIHSV